MGRKKQQKIYMEDYLNLLDSSNHADLSANFLNQIIIMHGFRKIYKVPKKVLVETLDAVELIKPWRSTVSIGNDMEEGEGEGEAEKMRKVEVEEVVRDLEELDWQECCVTSLQTIPASTISSPHAQTDTDAPLPTAGRKKRKRSKKNSAPDTSASATGHTMPRQFHDATSTTTTSTQAPRILSVASSSYSSST